MSGATARHGWLIASAGTQAWGRAGLRTSRRVARQSNKPEDEQSCCTCHALAAGARVKFPLAELARLMPVNASPGPLRGRPSRSDLPQAGGRKAGDDGASASHAQRWSNVCPVSVQRQTRGNPSRPIDDRSLPAATSETPPLRQASATSCPAPSASSLGRRQPVVTTHTLRQP